MDAFAGHWGHQTQVILDRPLTASGDWRLFNVTSFGSDYTNAPESREFIGQLLLNRKIWGNFYVNAGLTATSATGVLPSLGLQYAKGSREWVVVLLPRMDLTAAYNIELFGLVEWQPRLAQQWRWYTRLQGLYNHRLGDFTSGVTFMVDLA